jgi:cytoskeleton protein RodZ
MNAEAGVGSGAAGQGPGTPGELLRAQRERRALSVQQAAEDLHLDTWAIEAIEANKFLALGAPVYAKGHLRKYAALLGLSPEVVIARYEALNDTPAEPTPIPVTIAAPTIPERKPFRVPLWVFLVLLLAALGWLVFELLRPALQGDQSVVTAPLAEPPPPQAEPTQVETGPPASAPTATAASAAPVVNPAPPAVAAAPIRIRLEFIEPSWAEVYDANGMRLMYDTGVPERARNLTGVPPLRVTLGVTGAVTLQMGDRPIEIPRRDGRESSKFLIEADGTARLEGSAPRT